MALAKFLEDNVDRWLEEHENLFPSLIDLSPPPPLAQPRSGWIEVRHGRNFLEDFEVAVVKKPLKCVVRWQNGAQKPEASLISLPQRAASILRISKAGETTVILPKPGIYELLVKCGLHERLFAIEAIEAPVFFGLSRIQTAIDDLCRSADSWTREQLDQMRLRLLRCEKGTPEVPKNFCNGLLEYHLALLLEKEGHSAFGSHFECAYTLLRPYTKFSRQAAFIASYFLFRINNFAGLERLPPSHSRLLKMCGFFHRPFANNIAATNEKETGDVGAQFPMVIAAADEALLAAVESGIKGNVEDAFFHWERASRLTAASAFNRAAEQRLHFVAARLRRATGEVKRACFHYSQLDVSPESSFGQEAKQYLDKHRRR